MKSVVSILLVALLLCASLIVIADQESGFTVRLTDITYKDDRVSVSTEIKNWTTKNAMLEFEQASLNGWMIGYGYIGQVMAGKSIRSITTFSNVGKLADVYEQSDLNEFEASFTAFDADTFDTIVSGYIVRFERNSSDMNKDADKDIDSETKDTPTIPMTSSIFTDRYRNRMKSYKKSIPEGEAYPLEQQDDGTIKKVIGYGEGSQIALFYSPDDTLIRVSGETNMSSDKYPDEYVSIAVILLDSLCNESNTDKAAQALYNNTEMFSAVTVDGDVASFKYNGYDCTQRKASVDFGMLPFDIPFIQNYAYIDVQF